MAKQTPRSLSAIQQWMQAVITHPAGVSMGADSDEARRHVDVGAEHLESVIRRSKALTSAERLEVYADAYYLRLLDCLRSEFPALLYALGQEAFDEHAVGYLQAYPSQSYTLGFLGKSFPDYLRETRPADIPGGPEEPNWPEFLIDLAALERTYAEVFDGPGIETSPQLTGDDLATVMRDHLATARLEMAPCFRLVRFSFPVHEYASAVRHEESPEPPEPRETLLAVTRLHFVVRRFELTPVQFSLLTSLERESTVQEAVEEVGQSLSDEEFGQFAGSIGDWFSAWTANGFFAQVR
ncbi:hypothetical protein Pan216_23690 [Planctomycetes bacterium Pan216]|uniref:Putative DNA-binding domain-containing protein n=1 Tax=Kolteria novifilia TaxID=2527975 RepID=A0A518B3E3_9BACT|nr:hypothetical protein Pan216_23690 [Planctomycetes bacterium Pan216]